MKSSLLTLLFFFTSLAITGNGMANNSYGDDEYYEEDIDENLPFVEIKPVSDFSSLAEQARESDKVILLEVTASYCDYCHLLEEEIIKPMLRSGDYTENVLIRQLQIDNYHTISDLTGDNTTPASLARSLNIQITPTLIFLDGNGNEVAERILGVNSLDFFGAYVDEALDQALVQIKK